MTFEVKCGCYSLLAIENDILDSLGLENPFDSNLLRCEGKNYLREDSIYTWGVDRLDEDGLVIKVL